ncbi:19002_t:CDS:2 [Funneliformis geosporum]|nr:19002_t:CDS:2 [Funneliformis geosporum]
MSKKYSVKVSPIHKINLHDKYEFPDLWAVLHGKIKDLQERGFGEKEGSMVLTAQHVKEILADDFLNSNNLEGLLYRVFFQIATNFAFHGNEHYNLHRGIKGNAAQDIYLPSNSKAINDIKKYISKRPNGIQQVKI